VVQEEEKLQSVAQYDLGMRPKLKKSDKMKSRSLPSIQTVKPVDSASSTKTIQVRAFASPEAPIKKKLAKIIAIKRMEDIMISNRLRKLDVKSFGNGQKKVRTH